MEGPWERGAVTGSLRGALIILGCYGLDGVERASPVSDLEDVWGVLSFNDISLCWICVAGLFSACFSVMFSSSFSVSRCFLFLSLSPSLCPPFFLSAPGPALLCLSFGLHGAHCNSSKQHRCSFCGDATAEFAVSQRNARLRNSSEPCLVGVMGPCPLPG